MAISIQANDINDRQLNDDNKLNEVKDDGKLEEENNQRDQPKKRGKYNNIPPELKLEIAKAASARGIYAAIDEYPRLNLKYSSVSGWKIKYQTARANKEGISYCSIVLLFHNIFLCNKTYYKTSLFFACFDLFVLYTL